MKFKTSLDFKQACPLLYSQSKRLIDNSKFNASLLMNEIIKVRKKPTAPTSQEYSTLQTVKADMCVQNNSLARHSLKVLFTATSLISRKPSDVLPVTYYSFAPCIIPYYA